jgi:putative nucleotidyltransferase with HDIG domain
VRTVRGAVAFLGFNTVKTLVLGVSIVEQFRARPAVRGFDIDRLQAHSLETAVTAREMLRGTGGGDEAFSAGMLHDVGQLLLAARAPEEYSDVLIRTREGQRLELAERAIFGVDHAVVGAYLLGIWGLPQPLVSAVARHHLPEREVSERFGSALAVAMANKLCHDPDTPASDDPGEQAHIDLAHARAVGVASSLPGWRELARRVARNEEI